MMYVCCSCQTLVLGALTDIVMPTTRIQTALEHLLNLGRSLLTCWVGVGYSSLNWSKETSMSIVFIVLDKGSENYPFEHWSSCVQRECNQMI